MPFNKEEEDTLAHWRRRRCTADSLLEHYGVQSGLTGQEMNRLRRILRYAVECERRAWVAAQSDPAETTATEEEVPGVE